MSPSESITVPKLLQVESYETVHQVRYTCPSPSTGRLTPNAASDDHPIPDRPQSRQR